MEFKTPKDFIGWCHEQVAKYLSAETELRKSSKKPGDFYEYAADQAKQAAETMAAMAVRCEEKRKDDEPLLSNKSK